MSKTATSRRPKPVMLCILDGWGKRGPADDNAIAVVQRLIDGLGGLIGGLINTFDVGVLALHIDDDALDVVTMQPVQQLVVTVAGGQLIIAARPQQLNDCPADLAGAKQQDIVHERFRLS